MPQRFVCSKAKCSHRWESSEHQMTCCGAVLWLTLGGGGGLRGAVLCSPRQQHFITILQHEKSENSV